MAETMAMLKIQVAASPPEQGGNDAGDPPAADAFAPGAYQTNGEETETELDNAQRVDVEVAADGALFQLAITKL